MPVTFPGLEVCVAQTPMLAATRTHFQDQGGFLGGAGRPGAALWEPGERVQMAAASLQSV